MKKFIVLFAWLAFLFFENQAQKVVDYDGNEYDTVIIGTQTWLKPNLRVTHYNDGTPIPHVTDTLTWATLTTGARCYYANDSSTNDSVYGPLYNWYAVFNSNLWNICPAGWHVPTNEEWLAAEAYLGGAAGGEMKEEGTLHWASPNVGATNSTGFTGLPGGMRDPAENNFRTLYENGLWWTSTGFSSSAAWSTYMWNMFAGIDHNPTPKRCGFSIRCIKDVSTGNEELNQQGTFRLYPNPGKDQVTVESDNFSIHYLQVYNLFGTMVLKKEMTGLTDYMFVGFLPEGIYLVKISGRWEIKPQFFIKE